jgi:hypothetical protein
MSWRRSVAAVALALGASASSAQQLSAEIQFPCVTAPEAEALVTAILPETIEALAAACANQLPPGATLRSSNASFIGRYRSDADSVWPNAQKAVSRVIGADASGILGSNVARPVIASLLAPAIVKQVQPSECPSYDRIVTLAQPLPPRNLAGLLVSVWQLADARRKTGDKRPALSICPRPA